MNKHIVQKVIQNIYLSCHASLSTIFKKFKIMDQYEKIIVIWSVLVSFLVLFTPFMVISPNDFTWNSAQYVFLVSRVSLRKVLLCIQLTLSLSLLWSFHNKFRVYIVETLWFQWHNHLFSLFLFVISLVVLVSIGDIVEIFSVYTTILTLTLSYYISVIIVLLLCSLCFYLSFYRQAKHFRWHVVWYHTKREDVSHDADWSLFDSISHDE
jgi:hypothetical protein